MTLNETRCTITDVPSGYRWRIWWPNGGSVSGDAATWGEAAEVLWHELRESIYGRTP